MNYAPNTVHHAIGARVFHWADAKTPRMVMQVVAYLPDGRCCTVYAEDSDDPPRRGEKWPVKGLPTPFKRGWVNDVEALYPVELWERGTPPAYVTMGASYDVG